MIKTKIKKIAAVAAIAAMSASTIGTSFATISVGTGSVTGSASLDQSIEWDETFGTAGNASAIVSGIKVTASVAATMNVSFSTDEIALGALTPGTSSTGNLNIEVGTNAADGIKITMRSTNGGLQHTSNSELINNDVADGEMYKFSSVAANDTSTVAGITKTGLTAIESNVANKATEHVVYQTNKAEITENTDDVVVSVEAKAIATTSAGDYEDDLTFTISGNF